ncbi:MAG: hypothetical protein Q9178_006671 [Gyalolechia marmorata]
MGQTFSKQILYDLTCPSGIQHFLRRSAKATETLAGKPAESQNMEYFSLQLANSAVVTGLRTPAASEPPPKGTPLIVGLHGGSYSAEYYNATPTYSASPYSAFLRVPFVAINRPGYKDSTALPDTLPEGSTFFQEEGRYLHNEILPAIWEAYAAGYGVSSIVILAHSLAVPMTIVAAALHATTPSSSSDEQRQDQSLEVGEGQVSDQGPEREQDTSSMKEGTKPAENVKENVKEDEKENVEENGKENVKSYPLAGIVLSGFGTIPNVTTMARVEPLVDPNATRITFPPAFKDEIMLSLPSTGFTDPEIYEKTEELNTSVSLAEFADAVGSWPLYWCERYAKHVRCPVMYALVANDCFWMPTKKAMEDFAGSFENSVRVEKGVVLGGVHCLELCRVGRGWYARVFGWAMECGVAFGLGVL